MIWQNSCEWNRWHGEFVLEHSSSETQSISVAMEHWSVQHRAFVVETYLKNNDSVLTRGYFVGTSIFIGTSVPSRNTSSSEDISRARCTKKKTKDNGGFETEHQGRSSSNFSQHAATSDAELPETLGGMC